MSHQWSCRGRRLLLLTAIAAAAPLAAVAWAAEAPPATATAPAGDVAQQVKAITAEFEEAVRSFSEAYQAAENSEEKQKLVQEKYPKPSQYSPRLLEIARANPDAPAALEALQWVIHRDSGRDGKAGEALALIDERFAADPEVVKVLAGLNWTRDPAAERLLRNVMEKNPDRQAKGTAAFMLGRFLKNHSQAVRAWKGDPKIAAAVKEYYGEAYVAGALQRDPDAMEREAEQLFEQVREEYASVSGGFQRTLGKSAETELFEMRHLAIGKTAPDIEGEDVDGQPMKLSDYRGKVVVLDFWGDW